MNIDFFSERIKGLFKEPRELSEERQRLEDAHLLATDQKKPQIVEVNGRKVIVIDTGSGREVRPR